jgi:hypothetical protein
VGKVNGPGLNEFRGRDFDEAVDDLAYTPTFGNKVSLTPAELVQLHKPMTPEEWKKDMDVAKAVIARAQKEALPEVADAARDALSELPFAKDAMGLPYLANTSFIDALGDMRQGASDHEKAFAKALELYVATALMNPALGSGDLKPADIGPLVKELSAMFTRGTHPPER